jgi:hypothetical protein
MIKLDLPATAVVWRDAQAQALPSAEKDVEVGNVIAVPPKA